MNHSRSRRVQGARKFSLQNPFVFFRDPCKTPITKPLLARSAAQWKDGKAHFKAPIRWILFFFFFLQIMHLWYGSEPLSTRSRNGQDIKQTPSSGGFDDRCRRDDTDSFTLAHHIFYPRFPGSSFRARKQHRKCGNSTRCSNGAFSALSCSSNSAFFYFSSICSKLSNRSLSNQSFSKSNQLTSFMRRFPHFEVNEVFEKKKLRSILVEAWLYFLFLLPQARCQLQFHIDFLRQGVRFSLWSLLSPLPSLTLPYDSLHIVSSDCLWVCRSVMVSILQNQTFTRVSALPFFRVNALLNALPTPSPVQ